MSIRDVPRNEDAVRAVINAAAEVRQPRSGRTRAPTQVDILLELAQTAKLFHASHTDSFADLEIGGHRETLSVRGNSFRRWLVRGFFEATGRAPSSQALQSALDVIEARAQFEAPMRAVHLRAGELSDRRYLDLGDATWRAVEIDAAGWRLIDDPPLRFRRSAGMQALPEPVRGGSIDGLRRFINARSNDDFVLLVAWLLAALRARGPYPLLVLSGEQGSAKSTASAMARALVDPNDAPLRALPREDRDLFIAANNGHVLAFDNVSGLPDWTSDTLCRLSSGGGFAARQLYTDQDEILFNAARPVILNGIEDFVARPDLADRALFLRLEPISEERRLSEHELWAAFNAERPRILGALLDAMALGIAMLPRTRLDKLPRMADFALWAEACETALWKKGTFSLAYGRNRDEAVQEVVDSDPVASAVQALMKNRTAWDGTASQLLAVLSSMVPDEVRKLKGWPRTANVLGGRLSRAATFLRKLGINIERGKEGRSRTRAIRLSTTVPSVPESRGAQPSTSPASSVWVPKDVNASKPWPVFDDHHDVFHDINAPTFQRLEIT